MFVSQITWWVPHVFVWRSPKRSKMSSSAYTYPIRNTCGPPHGRGWLGSGSSRPTACTPGLHTQHAAPATSRGGLCRRGCPTKPYFSRRPRGGPHIFYMADELILERFGLRHTNTWGTHHVIWLTNECIFSKVDKWGRIYFDTGTVVPGIEFLRRKPRPRRSPHPSPRPPRFCLASLDV